MSRRPTLAALVICLALGAAAIACGGRSGPSVAATSTPYYTCTQTPPTAVPGSDLPTIENIPVPTVTSQPTVTASGLQIYELQPGSGAAAQLGGIIYINYQLWVQGGRECDSNNLAPVRFRMRQGELPDGLLEGITGMLVGAKRRLIVPPELGFGSTGSGNVIPPNATLIYDIELTAVTSPPAP